MTCSQGPGGSEASFALAQSRAGRGAAWPVGMHEVGAVPAAECSVIGTSPVAWWFLYVVECADGTLYTGIARDVAARLATHEAGRGARYTRGRGPLTLLGKRRCATHGDALRLELAIKRLSREEKRQLLASPRRFAALARATRRAPR